jgi:type I restriction enzyme S subunit
MNKRWTETTIGEVTAFTSKPRGLDLSAFDRVPFVPMELIPQGNTYAHDWTWKPGKDIRSGKYFEKGDCLMAKITPCFENGKQGIVRDLPADFGVASTELIPFRGRKGLSNKFFLFCFFLEATTRRHIAQKMEGATGRQRIPISVLKNWPVSLPPLPEQNKIAAVLLKIQRAIETQEKIIQSLRDLKKSTMQHLFTHGLRGEKTKITEIGEIPESWELVTLRTCCQVKSSTIAFQDLQTMDTRNEDDVPVHAIKVSDMNLPGNDRDIVHANIEVRLPEAATKKKAVSPLSIVFPKRGAAIATNKKRLTTEWTLLDPNIIAIVPDDSITPLYLYYWFLTFDLASLQDLGPTPQLNKKNVDPMEFPIPKTKEEQVQVASILDTIDAKLRLHESKKSALQGLFKTALNKLMTGGIRVQDLDIDVKEVEG